jgi:hypothetical protein
LAESEDEEEKKIVGEEKNEIFFSGPDLSR